MQNPDREPHKAEPRRTFSFGPNDDRGSRLRTRDDFFCRMIDPRQLLQPFEHIPGLLYFVKDQQSRLMAISHETALRMGFENEEAIIGRTVHEYLPCDLADKYVADDRWVITHGRSMQNVVEMFFNEQGVRDWIVTDKFPLRSQSGEVVGLVGIIQAFEARRRALAHLGPVGKAADYIREHLGEPIMVSEIATHAGFSERQLQRLFRRVFGMTVQQFMIQSRIHGAIHELTHSDRPIAEIAMRFGFGDQSAFSNSFRRATGMPPKAYRDRYVARSE